MLPQIFQKYDYMFTKQDCGQESVATTGGYIQGGRKKLSRYLNFRHFEEVLSPLT